MENKKQILKKAVASMTDIGRTAEEDYGPIRPAKKNEKYYPTLRLSAKTAPWLSNCDVGEKKTFVIEATLTHKEISEKKDGGNRYDYTFEVKKAGLAK